jgi:hypothetical protein
MRSILAAIGAALRGVFSFLVTFPMSLLGAMFGGTAAPAPAGDSPLVADLKAQSSVRNAQAIAEHAEQHAERIAQRIASWAMDSVIADRPVPEPTPPHVPRSVANWLPGLTRDECLKLIACDSKQSAAHVAGTAHIEGVRAVQKLYAEPWPPALSMGPEEAEPHFIAHAMSAAP